jgi:hypothetical protein
MIFAAVIALLGLGWLHDESGDTRIRVTVPREVSRAAEARLTLDDHTRGPILILHGLEVGAGEGLTFSVLAMPSDGKGKPIVLAVTGVAGRSQESPKKPLTRMELVVPLNARANDVIAGKTAVTLTLRVKNPARGPLRVERATFSPDSKPE